MNKPTLPENLVKVRRTRGPKGRIAFASLSKGGYLFFNTVAKKLLIDSLNSWGYEIKQKQEGEYCSGYAFFEMAYIPESSWRELYMIPTYEESLTYAVKIYWGYRGEEGLTQDSMSLPASQVFKSMKGAPSYKTTKLVYAIEALDGYFKLTMLSMNGRVNA